MNSRADIKEFILKLEATFNVNDWKVDGICIWPIIRIKLFFYLIEKIEGKPSDIKKNEKKEVTQSIKKNSFFNRIKNRIKNYLSVIVRFLKRIKVYLWVVNLPKVENVFVGANSHRENYENTRFNKFFDALVVNNNDYKNYLYLEYGDEVKGLFKQTKVFFFNKYLANYLSFVKREKKNNFITGLDDFLEYLNSNSLFKQFLEQNTKEKFIRNGINFSYKVKFFSLVLKKVSPKRVMTLCYYSDDVMALISAANKLQIETVEMQHGPQVSEHLCYGSWSKIPNEGYLMLPKTYWCWDKFSTIAINTWASKSIIYKTIIGGNPWVKFWQNKKSDFPFSNYILYSLQPYPLTIKELFAPSIIESIKKSSYQWFVRLHPRQPETIKEIEELLIENNIRDKVNVIDATNNPLPLVMLNAKLHITHSSGSTLEAIGFNIKSIVINNIGRDYYSNLIEEGKLSYIDYKDVLFYEKIKMFLE